MNDVYKFIRSLNLNNKTVVAGISGGPDSMLLLTILLDLKEELNLNIVVAHVHHNLRKESDDEAIFVRDFCSEKNIKFEMMKIEKYPDDKFSEESARKIRYDFFKSLMDKYKSDILFTAHHADDLMETILMRISRGSTLKGYAGFERISINKGYKIAKPLIYLEKKEIVKYLEEKGIKYVIDMSNETDNYRRNKYRHHILPVLKEENEFVHKKFLEYNEKILLANSYIEKQTNKIIDKVIKNNEIDLIEFKKLDRIIQVNILEKYLDKNYLDDITYITYKHVNLILDNLDSINTKIDMPLNKYILIEYNTLKLVDKIEVEEFDIEFTDEVILPNGNKIVIDNDTSLTSNYVIHLKKEELNYPLHVRSIHPGDKIKVKNMNGHKKASDILTDEKISKSKRNQVFVVTDNNDEIIWIPGIKKSYFDRKKDENYDIIFKYIVKEEKNE